MAECLDKNMIDKDEYPQTAEIETRCVNILSSLWHAPDAASGDRLFDDRVERGARCSAVWHSSAAGSIAREAEGKRRRSRTS